MSQGLERSKVLILGGGVAGLMAAKTLEENGVNDFMLIEANTRLGGRVHSVQGPSGHTLELGAGWIHGMDGNPLYDLVCQLNIQGKVTDYNDLTARDYRGNNVTPIVMQSLQRLHESKQRTKLLCQRKKIFCNESDLSQRSALRMSGWKPNTNEDLAIEYLTYDFLYGVGPDNVSLRFSDDFDPRNLKPNDIRLTDNRGYGHLIHQMANICTGDQRVHLGECVDVIKYSDSHVLVRTKCGKEYVADYAIVTFSIGVLQSGMVTFEPALPEPKLERIHSIHMTHYKKIFLGFAEKFWDDSELVLFCTGRRGYYSVWENLSFLGASILVSTVLGEEADRVSTLTQQQLCDELFCVLSAMYGAKASRPQWVLATDWGSNPLTLGSYSVRPVGFTAEDHEILQAPLGRLRFAGEAYSADSYGEVLGALETGVTEANHIAAAIMKLAPKHPTTSMPWLASSLQLRFMSKL